jgi:hypothetical protein
VPAALVVEQEIAHGVIGHENVRASVVIVVCYDHAHALPDVRGNAARHGYVRECTVAVVVIERVGQALVILGVAVSAIARLGQAAIGLRGRIPFAVIGDKQI